MRMVEKDDLFKKYYDEEWETSYDDETILNFDFREFSMASWYTILATKERTSDQL